MGRGGNGLLIGHFVVIQDVGLTGGFIEKYRAGSVETSEDPGFAIGTDAARKAANIGLGPRLSLEPVKPFILALEQTLEQAEQHHPIRGVVGGNDKMALLSKAFDARRVTWVGFFEKILEIPLVGPSQTEIVTDQDSRPDVSVSSGIMETSREKAPFPARAGRRGREGGHRSIERADHLETLSEIGRTPDLSNLFASSGHGIGFPPPKEHDPGSGVVLCKGEGIDQPVAGILDRDGKLGVDGPVRPSIRGEVEQVVECQPQSPGRPRRLGRVEVGRNCNHSPGLGNLGPELQDGDPG